MAIPRGARRGARECRGRRERRAKTARPSLNERLGKMAIDPEVYTHTHIHICIVKGEALYRGGPDGKRGSVEGGEREERKQPGQAYAKRKGDGD